MSSSSLPEDKLQWLLSLGLLINRDIVELKRAVSVVQPAPSTPAGFTDKWSRWAWKIMSDQFTVTATLWRRGTRRETRVLTKADILRGVTLLRNTHPLLYSQFDAMTWPEVNDACIAYNACDVLVQLAIWGEQVQF